MERADIQDRSVYLYAFIVSACTTRGRSDILKLNMPKGTKDIHVFVERHKFPIAVFLRDDWEKTQLDYLKPDENTTESLCDWCDKHNVQYQVLYPSVAKSVMKSPLMYYKYRKMIDRLCNQ